MKKLILIACIMLFFAGRTAYAAPQVKNVGNFNNYVLTSGFVLTQGLQYTVQVSAVDAAGESPLSNPQTFVYNPPTTTGILNWTAPTTGVDGLPLTTPILFYNVYLFSPTPSAAPLLYPVK